MISRKVVSTLGNEYKYRVRPTVRRGIFVYFLYMIIFYATFIITKVDYTRIAESADTLYRWFIPCTLGLAIVPLVFVTFYGWWRPAVIEQKKLSSWAFIIPAITGLIAVVNLILGNSSRLTSEMWIMLVVGSICVGFNEEMINRGQLIVGLRSRYGERGVWLISTAMFAVFHLPNIFFGTGLIGLIQVPIAFGMGTVFYLARRTTGTLIAAMALHALWDFSVFATGAPIMGVVGPVLGIVAVIVVVFAGKKTE